MIYEQRTKGGKLACRDADLEKNKKTIEHQFNEEQFLLIF